MPVVPQVPDRHVTLEVIGWQGSGKAEVGRVVAAALREHHAHVEVLAKSSDLALNFCDGQPMPGGDLAGQDVTIWLVEPH